MISYKDDGVDIDAGNSFAEGIKPFVKSTLTPNVIGGIGSFSGAFRLPSGYNKPRSSKRYRQRMRNSQMRSNRWRNG